MKDLKKVHTYKYMYTVTICVWKLFGKEIVNVFVAQCQNYLPEKKRMINNGVL